MQRTELGSVLPAHMPAALDSDGDFAPRRPAFAAQLTLPADRGLVPVRCASVLLNRFFKVKRTLTAR